MYSPRHDLRPGKTPDCVPGTRHGIAPKGRGFKFSWRLAEVPAQQAFRVQPSRQQVGAVGAGAVGLVCPGLVGPWAGAARADAPDVDALQGRLKMRPGP